jgi:hypothetical protein
MQLKALTPRQGTDHQIANNANYPHNQNQNAHYQIGNDNADQSTGSNATTKENNTADSNPKRWLGQRFFGRKSIHGLETQIASTRGFDGRYGTCH